MPHNGLPPGIARTAGQAITAAVRRGAIAPDRVEHYVSQVVAAGTEAEAEAVVEVIDQLWGEHGPGRPPGDDGGSDPGREFASLWPPKTAAEAELRGQIAASSAREWTDDQLYEAIFKDQPPS
jgi:hypothetical protein